MNTSAAVSFEAQQMRENLRSEGRRELSRIIDWWAENMVDEQQGGFYGRIDGHGNLDAQADKAVILNTRLLWTFSAAARQNGELRCRELATRAFHYMMQYFWDHAEGGVYWMLDYLGQPVQDKKQVYAQAFALYAFSEYYLLTHDPEALEKARELCWLIEHYSHDEAKGGYFEAYSRHWKLLEDLRLSDKDANEAKTMNTHLHILEAYTNLYRAEPNSENAERLQRLIEIHLDKFVDPATNHLQLFFDENWQLKSDEISFGHDIEAAWLLADAAATLQNLELIEKTKQLAINIARVTLQEGTDPQDGALYNSAGPEGLRDRAKDWWPQAEAVVGYLHAWQFSGDPQFIEAATRSWQFIQEKLIDREKGEWFWALQADNCPDREHDKAGPWKCPYHNGRACILVMSDE